MAKFNAQAFKDMVDTQQLATKGDIGDVRSEIEAMRREIRDSKHDVPKWMVTAMLAQTALLVGILTFLR